MVTATDVFLCTVVMPAVAVLAIAGAQWLSDQLDAKRAERRRLAMMVEADRHVAEYMTRYRALQAARREGR